MSVDSPLSTQFKETCLDFGSRNDAKQLKGCIPAAGSSFRYVGSWETGQLVTAIDARTNTPLGHMFHPH